MTADIVVDLNEVVAKPSRRISTVQWLCILGALGLVLQTLSIWLSRLHPLFELPSHFAVHGVCLGLLLVPAVLYYRRKLLAICAFTAWSYLLLLVHPWSLYTAAAPSALPHSATSVKVLVWNILVTNQSYEQIESLVIDHEPDVVILIETPPGLPQNLPTIVNGYPMSRTYLHWGGGGICVFSRVAGTEIELLDFECSQQPAMVATIPSSTGAVKLVGMHPLSPLPVSRAIVRDKQLRAFARWAQAIEGPVCVCGDFNTTPWSASFRDLLSVGLRDSREGVGNCPSWPRSLGPIGIPIDHVLSKGNCSVSDRRVLSESPGSDHAPVVFTLAF